MMPEEKKKCVYCEEPVENYDKIMDDKKITHIILCKKCFNHLKAGYELLCKVEELRLK